MKNHHLVGVYEEHNRLYTKTLASARGKKVYTEQLKKIKKEEYRSWNPYKSKLSAALQKNLQMPLSKDDTVLYLGAATGTTVSHLSDILTEGTLFAVENSPVAMHDLLNVCKDRANIIPLLEDAFHPDRYSAYLRPVDLLYQDISQRNQAAIFTINMKQYLKSDGTGILMVKARSIDVSLKPQEAYQQVQNYLATQGFHINTVMELHPYEKDHAVMVITHG